MGVETIVLLIVVGAAAGWITKLFWEGTGLGLVFDIIIGVACSLGTGYLIKYSGITVFGLDPTIIVAIVVTLVILFLIMGLKKKKE